MNSTELLQSISDFIPLSVTIIIAVLITATIVRAILKIEPFSRLTIPLAIICAPGTVLHELGHLLFATITGSRIDEVNLFYYKKTPFGSTVGGSINGEFPDSLLARFFISMGPTILNGFLVSVIIFFMDQIPEGLSYYLIFALVLGARPSTADIKMVLSTFNEHGSRSLFELSSVGISSIIGIVIATWNLNSLHEINWLFFTVIFVTSLASMLLIYKMVTITR